MNKWITVCLTLLLWLAVAPFAAAWGELDSAANINYESRHDPSVHPYLIESLVRGNSIRLFVKRPPLHGEKSHRTELIKQAYQGWFDNALDFIHRQNREEEFADIIPFLQKGREFTLVSNKEEADLVFIFSPQTKIFKLCHASAVTCYSRSGTVPTIFFPIEYFSEKHAVDILAHEIGHAMGLSDQKEELGVRNNSHRIYSTPQTSEESQMGRAEGFTCDDADGLIHLIEGSLEKFIGGEKGWKSFCKTPGYTYVEGVPAPEKTSYILGPSKQHEEDLPTYTLFVIGKEGLEREVVFKLDLDSNYSPFDEPLFTEDTEWDKQGRQIYGRSSTGEEEYIMYHYDETYRIVVKDGKLLLSETISHNQPFFNQYGAVVAMQTIQQLVFAQNKAVDEIAIQKVDDEHRITYLQDVQQKIPHKFVVIMKGGETLQVLEYKDGQEITSVSRLKKRRGGKNKSNNSMVDLADAFENELRQADDQLKDKLQNLALHLK